MTQYNVDHDFSSPYRVLETTRPLLYLPGSLRSLQVQFEKSLLAYFDRYTVDEWIEQHIKPLIKSVEDLNKKAEVLTSKTAWPHKGRSDLRRLWKKTRTRKAELWPNPTNNNCSSLWDTRRKSTCQSVWVTIPILIDPHQGFDLLTSS